MIRKPASFMTSICDERGQELLYAGMPITAVFKEEMGIGGVLSLLWFQVALIKWESIDILLCTCFVRPAPAPAVRLPVPGDVSDDHR